MLVVVVLYISGSLKGSVSGSRTRPRTRTRTRTRQKPPRARISAADESLSRKQYIPTQHNSTYLPVTFNNQPFKITIVSKLLNVILQRVYSTVRIALHPTHFFP